jgi:hypothetical protein
MAAQGEQDLKWLATMDSEAIISSMSQLKQPREADKSVPVALTTKKRTPRKRTKSVKAAEAEEAAELLDADSSPPAKKPCAEATAVPLALPAPTTCAPMDHTQAVGTVPLFKPVSEHPAGATVDQNTDHNTSNVPAAEDTGSPMPTEEIQAVDARAPEPVGSAVPTWIAQHIAPVEQISQDGAVVAPPEPAQTLEHSVHHGVCFYARISCFVLLRAELRA